MGKFSIYIVLTAVLLGVAIPKSFAAADQPGSSVTATSPDNTSGAASGTPINTTDNPAPATANSPINTTEPTDAVTAEPSADTGVKAPVKAESKETAVVQLGGLKGKYFGGKFGIINSSASGSPDAHSASTLAYGLQGGYLQGGYLWNFNFVVVGLGAYADWNNYTVHTSNSSSYPNGIKYASKAYGLDAKLGVQVGDWLPYVKKGYGYSTGTRVYRTVAQKGSNVAAGFEYNFAPRWTAIAEYKWNKFSNPDGSITIYNKLFSFGFNYYFDMPLVEKAKVELAPEVELAIPEPILAPGAVPEAPPPP